VTTRILPVEDYRRIAGTDLSRALPILPGTKVIVCEHEGAIVGHLGLIPMWHVEGVEVDPAYRGRGVLQQLITAMHAEARTLGVYTLFPAAADAGMVHLLERLGAVEIPVRMYALAVQEG